MSTARRQKRGAAFILIAEKKKICTKYGAFPATACASCCRLCLGFRSVCVNRTQRDHRSPPASRQVFPRCRPRPPTVDLFFFSPFLFSPFFYRFWLLHARCVGWPSSVSACPARLRPPSGNSPNQVWRQRTALTPRQRRRVAAVFFCASFFRWSFGPQPFCVGGRFARHSLPLLDLLLCNFGPRRYRWFIK